MKFFNLYMRSGTPDISEEFKSEGDRIIDARNFLFSHDPGSDYVFPLTLDRNGNPMVGEYTNDDIEGEEEGGSYYDTFDYIDQPHNMDDVL